MNTVHFSHKAVEWETPQPLFDALNAEFHFDLDPAASHTNHKCARYYTVEDDGLRQAWDGRVFLNPPYGRGIGEWVGRAAFRTMRDACPLAVCLLPVRTDTKWFHGWCWAAYEIRLLKGRIRFVGAEQDAPFPSMLVIFRAGNRSGRPHFGPYDTVRYGQNNGHDTHLP